MVESVRGIEQQRRMLLKKLVKMCYTAKRSGG